MLVWGLKLVQTTWYQSIAEFPIVSAGMAYLPIPIGGALTTLFVIERLLTQKVLLGARARDRSARFRPSSGRAPWTFSSWSAASRIVCLMGMPVAYALGLAAILGALWTGIPLEAVMLKVSGGMSGFSLLAIPFFILCGAIMAVGGMAERLVNLAKVFVGFIRGGMALVNIVASTMFGCISGSSVADTAAVGSVMIPQMIKNGYPRLFAVNVTISGSLQPLLLPPSHNMIIYSLAAGGTISVAHLFMAGVIPGAAAGPVADRAGPHHRASGKLPKGRGRPAAAGAQDRARRGLGPGHHRHHPRRHSHRRVHADRIRGRRLRLRLPGHHVRLSRLQVARSAKTDRARGAHGWHGDDHDRLLDRLRLHDGDPAGTRPRPRHSSSPSRATNTPSCSTSTSCCCCSARSWIWRRCC